MSDAHRATRGAAVGGASEVGAWLLGLWSITRRELLTLFVTPLAYLVATLFLLQQGWNFSLLLRFLNDPLAAPGPVMQFYFGGSFFIFWLPVVFICAAITMRSIAEERRMGTLEALLTAPVHPSQVVIGKYLGALIFYAALWIPTGVFYVLLRGATSTGPGAAPELGPILSGYLGTMLVGASFLAIGVLASALARAQLAAAIATFVTCTIALLAGLLVDQVTSPALTDLLEWTSLLAMMQEMAVGIVDTRWLWLHAGVVVTCLAAAVVAVDPRRDAQRLLQALCIGIIALNAAVLGGIRGVRGDWTHGGVYTLSERSHAVLETIARPVEVTILMPSSIGGGRSNPARGEIREVLLRMAQVQPLLRVRALDPDRDRQFAEQLLGDFSLSGRELADGVILIRSGQGIGLRRAWLYPSDLVTFATGPEVQANGPRVESFRGEEALLAKFLEVTEDERRRVCFTQGHGEPAFDNLEPYAGFARLRDLLRDANLETRVADLDGASGLAGCDVLLVAGPTGPLPAARVDVVRRFVEDGGALLVMSGAVVRRSTKDLAQHGLEPLLAQHGIVYGERVVVSPHAMPGGSPLLAFTLQSGWGDHPAVRSLVTRPVSFVAVRELSLEGAALPLVSVGEDGWAESDIASLALGVLPRPHGPGDRAGPIPVAAAVEDAGRRIAVIGSDQFAVNALLRDDVAYDFGRDFILNVMGWLTQRDALLGIRPRPREHVKLVLQPDQLERMTWVCLIGLPAFAIALGFLVLFRRRQ